jgi:hypothetical protein
MGNNITDLVELLEPTGDDSEVDEETGTVVEAKETEDEEVKSTETPEDEPTKDDETKEDEEPTDEDKEEEDKEDKVDPLLDLEEQNRELRQILRQQKKDMDIMQSKLTRIEKRSAKATEDADEILFGDEKKPDEEAELSELETIQNELTALAQTKAPILETLVEAMELNPTYADVRQVCSQANFSEMFSAVGDALHEKEGIDPILAAMQAEVAVWKMPNPYKYMYDIIKKHHPSYVEQEAKPKDKKLPDKPPTSLANVPGKAEAVSKWTSARIDEMPEEDIGTVPDDIYQKYLEGDLD